MPDKQAAMAKVIESRLDLHRPRLTTTVVPANSHNRTMELDTMINEQFPLSDQDNSVNMSSQNLFVPPPGEPKTSQGLGFL